MYVPQNAIPYNGNPDECEVKVIIVAVGVDQGAKWAPPAAIAIY